MVSLTDTLKTPPKGQPLPRTDPRALILVVDDHADSRELVKYLLEHQSYRVLEAEDGEAAIATASTQRPNLVLMDVGLPNIDGIEAIKRLRELPGLLSLPVIFVSAHAEFSYREQAMAAGGVDYLTKPYDADQLLRLVARYVFGEAGSTIATRC